MSSHDKIIEMLDDSLQLNELYSIAHRLEEAIRRLEPTSGHQRNEEESILIDAPLEASATHGTSLLKLKFLSSFPSENLVGWREVSISQNAQIELISILATHLSGGEAKKVYQLPKITKQ